MAELLFCTVDKTHAAKNPNGRYKRGHCYEVREDGATYGRLEDIDVWVAEGNAKADYPNNNTIIRVPGPASDYRRLVAMDEDIYVKPDVLPGEKGDMTIIKVYRDGVFDRNISITEEFLHSPRSEEFTKRIRMTSADDKPIGLRRRRVTSNRRLWRCDLTGLAHKQRLTRTQLRNRMTRFDGAGF